MVTIRRTRKLVALFLLFTLLVIPAEAQDTGGPGKGGIITIASWGIPNFNPVLCADTTCLEVLPLLFPSLVRTDPFTGELIKGAPGTLATDWTISDDGQVYTFTLRQDWNWSDGVPITAQDVSYFWGVYSSPDFGMADAFPFANVEALDDHTVRITFKEANCSNILWLALTATPSHVFEGVPFSELENHPFSTNPSVTAGPFKFGSLQAGDMFSLVADQNYPDAQLGYVLPEGLVFRVIADPTAGIERFLAGEMDVIYSIPVGRRSDIRTAAAQGDMQIYEYTGDIWDYMAFNLADPKNPQSAFDADGKPLDQGNHPIFGDVRVRQAIARAVNVDDIIRGAVFGEGERMAANIVPGSWATNPALKPIAYDPVAAENMLAEAGWRDENGDGIREAHGALYAPDDTPLQFSLLTNQGNERRTAIGTIMQDELKQIGVQVDFQTVEFSTLGDILNGQKYDAIILGWGFGAYVEPDQGFMFTPDADVLDYGLNFTSYNNPEVNRLFEEGATVADCASDKRAPYYYRIQEIMQRDNPYLWLYAVKQMYAANSHLKGFDPLPGYLFHNADSWSISP